MLTGSRSGLVGLAVVVAFIVWRSPHRVALAAMVAIIAVAMVAVMSADMRERYLSLAEHGTRHSQTRDGRIEGTKKELKVAIETAPVWSWPRHVGGSHASFRWPCADSP